MLFLGELKSKLVTATNTERSAKEENVKLKAKVADVEGQLSSVSHQHQLLQMKLDQQSSERQLSENELKRF